MANGRRQARPTTLDKLRVYLQKQILCPPIVVQTNLHAADATSATVTHAKNAVIKINFFAILFSLVFLYDDLLSNWAFLLVIGFISSPPPLEKSP